MRRRTSVVALSFLLIFALTILSGSAVGICGTKKIKVNVKKLTLVKNDTYTLRVYNLTKKQTVKFVSEDETIVSVDKDTRKAKTAQIKAVNVGSSTVRANIYNRKGKLVRTLKTKIQVTPYAISVQFTQKKVNLYEQDTMKLSVIIKPNTSLETPVFESSDTDVVTVNSKGIITAIAPGNATITATLLSSGKTATCTIQVLPKEPEEPDDDTVPVGNSSPIRK